MFIRIPRDLHDFRGFPWNLFQMPNSVRWWFPNGIISHQLPISLGDLAEEGPVAEKAIPDEPVQPDPVEEMVQKRSMALDCWFPTVQASGGQAIARPTLQQTTPLASQQRRKRQKGANGIAVGSSTPPAAHLPTSASVSDGSAPSIWGIRFCPRTPMSGHRGVVKEGCGATTTEKALELVEQKASDLQGRLRETKLKLSTTASILSARDKELTDLKGAEKARKQTYYNKGFKDAENSAGPLIFQAQKFGFMEGWMTVVKTQAEEQGEDSSDEEEGTESSEARELSKQIDSHVVVLDYDNSRTATTTSNPDAVQPVVTSDLPPTNPPAG
nr:hypothetical protein CFP56_67247 [Quercus suber]